MPYLEGAKGVEITDSILYDIQGNATFNFTGDGPIGEDLKALLVDHLTGAATKLYAKLEKHTLGQSISNLPRANAAYNDHCSRDKTRVSCFKNTRQALLKEAGEWIFAALDTPEIFLLSGLAGIGKSTVAQTIAERAYSAHLLGASFFFSRDETDRRTAKKFCATIAFQLCNYDERFAQAIGNELLKEKGTAAMSKGLLEQVDALIVEPLRNLVNQRSRPLVLVVDALDECDEEDALDVLNTLQHVVHELPSFKVVITSRPRPRHEGFLDQHRIFRMHEIEDKIVDDDIRVYLKYRLSCEQVKQCLNLKDRWGADDCDIESLVKAAGRLFIIASTAVLFILDTLARNPASQMKKLQDALAEGRAPFKTLDDFYTIVLRSAVPTNCDSYIAERYQAVVGAIIVVQDPLPLEALANLIGLDSADVQAVLDHLQPVILLGSNAVPRIYHKSFFDFVTDAERCKYDDLLIIPRDRNTQITAGCLDVMNACLKRNILGLGTPAQFMGNSAGLEAEAMSNDQIGEKISRELRYACVFWANHFEVADTEDANLIAKVIAFAKEHMLHWFEALSWICKLDLAPRDLLLLRKLLVTRSAHV
jgi:hypothetical protein